MLMMMEPNAEARLEPAANGVGVDNDDLSQRHISFRNNKCLELQKKIFDLKSPF